MGRGLSKVQQQILSLAHQWRESDLESGNSVDIYVSEILGELFGWESQARGGFRPAYRDRRFQVRNHFSRSKIGEREYDSAMSSVSRSITRLQKKGLVAGWKGASRRWTGIEITDEGIEQAEKLTVKKNTQGGHCLTVSSTSERQA